MVSEIQGVSVFVKLSHIGNMYVSNTYMDISIDIGILFVDI